MSRTASYALLFLITGSTAVVIRWLGENSKSRLAGLVATVPVKILIAWFILNSTGGTGAVRDSIPGMAIGLTAMAVLLGAAWFASARFNPSYS